MNARNLIVISLVSSVSFSCSASDEGVDLPDDVDARSYYEDIAPILEEHCHDCHRPGGAGPFVLETYEDVEPIADLVRHSMENRTMPPWLADNSGECKTYKDARWLPQEQIDAVSSWVDDGMHAGDPANMPAFTVASEHLDDATHEIKMPEAYVPVPAEGGNDDYRCFIIDPGVDREKFLTSYEIVPGDPKIVHHVLAYEPMDDEAVAEARQFDADEAGQGYTCFGGPSVDAMLVAAWAPGRNVWHYPEGMGVPVQANRPLILEVHYNVVEGAAPDQTAVRFKLEDEVDNELLPWFFANTELALNPGDVEALARFEMSTEVYMEEGYEEPQWAVPMTLVGIAPHMHLIGKSERLEITHADGSGTECLLDVPRWDFNWQFAYFYEEPVRIEPRDLLKLSCEFDTSDRSEMTYWGDGTADEMCLTLMFVTFEGGKIPR